MNKQDIEKMMEAYLSVVSEKSVSQQQQKLMGLALAYKRGEVSADKISPEAKAMADKMSEKDLEDFAKTKHKGLPVTKEEAEQVDEGPDYLGDIRRKKERDEKKKASQHDGETQRQKMMRKVYGKAMGGLKKEEVELDEAAKMSAKSQEWYDKGYAMGKNPSTYKSPPFGIGGAAMDAFRKGRKAGEASVKKEEVELEESSDKYMVKYTGPDKSGRTSGPFSKAAAEKKAAMGNKADKVGGKYEVLRYVESVEESLNEELWKEIEAYAKKHGGIDKKDMMKVAMMLKKGDRKGAVKYARGLDTDPRDWLLDKMDESAEQELESLEEKSCGKDMKKEKMDPVDKKALKKDFDDRDDKDIDNDGEVDDSDEYLHNRRKAISKKTSKDSKTAEVSKIGEAFEEMWAAIQEAAEPATRKKNATPPEAIDSKESPKSKEFIAKHAVEVEDEEETHQTATDAGRATKPAAARPGDNKAGDKNIVNPVQGAVKEDNRTYWQKIVDVLDGKTWNEIDTEEMKKTEE